MKQRMQDDEFEALLGRALRIEKAPAGLEQRVRKARHQGHWFMWLVSPALISPGRIAASAAILSLMMGFALGWGNTSATEDQDLDMAAILYAANDVGDF